MTEAHVTEPSHHEEPSHPTEPSHVTETRAAYDTVAVDYASLLEGELARSPLDRALLGHFAELVGLEGGGPVVDVGCGPGRITGHLASLGLDVSGIDLSPGMVAEAQRRHPDLDFRTGSLAALGLPDASVTGVVAWYSIIHTPPELLPEVFVELHRVIRANGLLLLAFQAGGFSVRHEQAYGHAVTFEAHRHDPDGVAAQLADAGFRVTVRTDRVPQDYEKTPQAFLLARRG
ncbi:methyltransferase [Terrabacter sp. Root85]|uniref:class I SAM-dependent DNA methyltransferase n=1 Tax=Terrabacter sp. Root85 TaxID=1736603 RepID=UPI0006F2DAC0|nr:class I SAM-dependent methyltransferase [Terrabacter sp. Root85]KRC92639.1 methyltransferase [Terrabacter sp. Root85]